MKTTQLIDLIKTYQMDQTDQITLFLGLGDTGSIHDFGTVTPASAVASLFDELF